MPTSRPRVVFADDGECNACKNAKEKKDIDWDARRKEFIKIIEQYKSQNNYYDCIVPWSGGKDSSAIAYKLKFEFGLNPLLVTFSPLIPNEVAVHNREEMLKAGFDSVLIRPNQKVAQHLSRRFFKERGHPKVAWDAGINAATVRIAVSHKIPLVFYAEHGESEYGGRVLSEEHKKIRDLAEVLEHQIGDDPQNWTDDIVTEKDLIQYVYPDLEEVEKVGLKAMYFSYFFPWSMYDNYQYIKEKIDFRTHPNGRTDGTFTNFDSLDDKIDNVYYYMQYVKFGFGRATRDASRLIQLGVIDRDEGLEYVRKYDHEKPHTHFKESLEYLGLTEKEFEEIVDLHRNQEIWNKADNDWKLAFEVK